MEVTPVEIWNMQQDIKMLRDIVREFNYEQRELEKKNNTLVALVIEMSIKMNHLEMALARRGVQPAFVPISGSIVNNAHRYIQQYRDGHLGPFSKEDVDALIKKLAMGGKAEDDDEWIEQDQPIEEEQLAIEQPEVVQPPQQLYPPLPPMLPLNEVQNFAPARGGGRGGGVRGGGIRGGFRGAGRGGRNTGRGGGGGGRGGRNGGRGGGNRCPIV